MKLPILQCFWRLQRELERDRDTFSPFPCQLTDLIVILGLLVGPLLGLFVRKISLKTGQVKVGFVTLFVLFIYHSSTLHEFHLKQSTVFMQKRL